MGEFVQEGVDRWSTHSRQISSSSVQSIASKSPSELNTGTLHCAHAAGNKQTNAVNYYPQKSVTEVNQVVGQDVSNVYRI